MRTVWLVIGVAVLAAAVVAADQDRLVTFRVTYASGIVADVLSPPTTHTDIKSVQRIVAVPGSVNLSTDDGADDMTQGKLSIANLLWDGTTWSAPRPNPALRKGPVPNGEDVVSAEIRKTEQLLLRMQESLKTLDHQAAEAQRKIDATPAGDEVAAKAASDKLADVQRQRASLLKMIDCYRDRQAALEKLGPSDSLPGLQAGAAPATMPAPAADAEPISDTVPQGDMPSNIQVIQDHSGNSRGTRPHPHPRPRDAAEAAEGANPTDGGAVHHPQRPSSQPVTGPTSPWRRTPSSRPATSQPAGR